MGLLMLLLGLGWELCINSSLKFEYMATRP